ncbi:hypothetical protein B0H21DRAFT_279432 [Amylocystis lapponica]|nr:hypothetical protein B0H21DRAFT_279432 [Amylocystis lapponica]
MSFIYSYARFTAYVLLCLMHAVFLGLLALPLFARTGGAAEITAMVLSALAFLFNFAHAICFVRRGDSGPEKIGNIVFAGIIWIFSLLASIVVTARSRDSGLQRDYAGLGENADTVQIVVPLSWCTSGVALAALVAAYIHTPPGITEITSFGTHRVVWRRDRIPMHNVVAKQSSDSSLYTTPSRDNRLQRPTLARTHWSERQPTQFRTTYDPWPRHDQV